MRNLALVGIAASPGGGEVFGSRAEEELRLWLETRLNALGYINPVAYSRSVLSLLRRPNSALSPPEEASELGRGAGRRIRARPKAKPSTHGEGEHREAVMQYLKNAADDKCGVETLVDELCIKLEELEGGSSHNEKEGSILPMISSGKHIKSNIAVLTPLEQGHRYAVPALQSASIKKSSPQKDRNFANSNNNRKNGINFHNYKNSARRKTKMSVNIESQRSEESFKENKDSFAFVKSVKREMENEMDQLRLAQFRAKFNTLEALWNSVPGNAQDTASIWAAPTLSIPSKPLWPADTTKTIYTLPTSDGHATDTPNQVVDESPLIPLDIDLISIEDNADECSYRFETEYNVGCSKSAKDGPWCWGGIDSNFTTGLYCHNSQTGSCFLPVASCKTPNGNGKESRSSLKVNSLPEPDEDLLTSARTHFRPIKDDGSHWADGTTFPVNNTVERVAYRRSESGNLLYLPGGESPYMEYRESDVTTTPVSTNLTLKFRVRQCDKSVQTEPIRSPVKRRILSEQDHFRYSPVGAEDAHTQEQENIEKDSFALDQLGWVKTSVPLHNDRKRRHSSSFGCQPLTTLRPLTL